MSGLWERLFEHRVQDYGQVGQDFYVVDSDFAGSTSGDQFTRLMDLPQVMAAGRVFRTGDYADDSAAIQAAIDATIGSRGDTIHFCPGDYRIVDSLALNKRGIRLLGPPVRHPARSLVTLDGDTTAGLADELANITAADIEIAFMRLIPDSGQILMDYTAAADGLYVHDFFLDLRTPGVAVATKGFVAIGAASNPWIERFHVECDGAQGAAFITPGVLDGVIRDGTVFLSAGSWASPFDVGLAVDRLRIDGIKFLAGVGTALFTTCIDGTDASIVGGVQIDNCRFPSRSRAAGGSGGPPIDNFGTSEAQLSENYSTDLGGGSGGTLITAIT